MFCLLKRHYLNDCQSHFRCNEDNCKCKRYSLFHQELTSGDLAISNFNIDSERDNNKFLQIIPVIIQEGNNTVSTLALLDTMLISEKKANKYVTYLFQIFCQLKIN